MDHHRSRPVVVASRCKRDRSSPAGRSRPEGWTSASGGRWHPERGCRSWAVERTLRLRRSRRADRRSQGILESLLGQIPQLDLAHVLLRIPGGQIGLELLEPEVAQHHEHEVEEVLQLVGDLRLRREDVAVVLGETPRPQQAVDDSRSLVSVDGPQFVEAHRQLSVATTPAPEDQDVERAVHRFERYSAAVVQCPSPGYMPRRRSRRGRTSARGRPWRRGARRHLVVEGLVGPPAVVLDRLPEHAALRVPHGKATPQLGREGVEIELGAELAVISQLGLLEPLEVRIEAFWATPMPCRRSFAAGRCSRRPASTRRPYAAGAPP